MHGIWVRMLLDIGETCQRYAYLCGRCRTAHLAGWITAGLSPGDVFIDIGANVG